MSRHWKHRGSGWLSPDAYDALSPAEKRAIWLERKTERATRGRHRRHLKGHYARQRWTWFGFCALFMLTFGSVWELTDTAPETAITTEAPTVVLPYEQVDPADAEWESRGAEGENRPSTLRQAQDRPSSGRTAGSGARVAFGFCHSGGGSNCVVDGDTFYIGGAKVRIAGIDTPETHPPRCAHEAELGAQATARLHALLNSGAVTMTVTGRNRDSYGRLLRHVQVDGADVGAAMVSAGVAREYGRGRRGWCG